MAKQKFTVVIKRKIPLKDLKESFKLNNIKIVKSIKNMDNTFIVSCDEADLNKVEGILASHNESNPLSVHVCEWHKNRVVTKQLPLRDEFDPLFDGTGTTVYVVDSGIDIAHPEFKNSQITLLYSMFSDFADNLKHGTAMTSLIVGETCGIAQKAHIKFVKVFDVNNQETLMSDLLVALDKILEDHLITKDIAKVVNMSWTTPKNPLLDFKIVEMRDKNLVVVCASGNNGEDVNNYSPAGIDVVTTVGATDEFDRIAAFTNLPHETVSETTSNVGSQLDIFAPGSNVKVATAGGTYSSSSGTSISSAIVAASACHYIQQDNSASSEVIKDRILQESTQNCIYSNTVTDFSNRMIFVPCVYYKDMWAVPSGRLCNVKKGSGLITYNLQVESEITEIIESEYVKLPSFIKLDDKTLTIDSNTSDTEKIYHFILIAKNKDGYEYPKNFSVGLYISTETDLEKAEEVYTGEDGSYHSTYISAATSKQ